MFLSMKLEIRDTQLKVRGARIVFALVGLFAAIAAHAQVLGTWKSYLSYHEPQQIVKGGNRLFVRASNGLYSYNLNDHSIITYDKARQLNDTEVRMVAWNPTTKKLIVVYEDSNIDLIDQNDESTNISALYTKALPYAKTVNAISMHEQYAYLALPFGIMKVDMQKNEIAETYMHKLNIATAGVKGDSIYARVEAASTYLIGAALKDNLIDIHNWKIIASVPDGIFPTMNRDWTEYIETVRTLNPDGPKYNNFGFLRFSHGSLYGTDHGHRQGYLVDYEYPATIQQLDGNGEWTIFDEDIKGKFEGTDKPEFWTFVDMSAMDVDPFDPTHVFGSSRTGLFEFRNGKCVAYYHPENSGLKSTFDRNNSYIVIESVMFDGNGNLWILQSMTPNNTLVCLTKEGEWQTPYLPQLLNSGASLASLESLIMDSRGLIWFVNNHFTKGGFFCYDPETGKIVKEVYGFNNQDGTTYGGDNYRVAVIREDMKGNLWIGTSLGLFYIEASDITSDEMQVKQVKVPRNDGSDLADYLLDGVNITDIAIDGADRKWVSTMNSGVYLISEDNMEEVHHFTADDSPLLSNTVLSVAVNPQNGEAFFGTDKGLCSYISDATTAVDEMKKDDVYAFPNPVPSGYNGLITVRGLSFDADVKILTIDGRLVAQGRSKGGTFTWNGRDQSGHRVASGVYMIATATSEGKSGVVAKVAVVK